MTIESLATPGGTVKELTLLPMSGGGAEVREGGGPYADQGPLIATFQRRADAELFVKAALYKHPAPFFRATYESRHFSFEGYGATAEEATATLERALTIHASRAPCADDFVSEAMREVREEQDYRRRCGDQPLPPLAFGVPYVDGTPSG